MKNLKKKLTLLALALTLCMLIANTTHAADGTVISVSPLSKVVQQADIGKTFQITINITASPPVIQWMLKVSWNPAVLKLQSDPVEGPFLSSHGSTMFLFKNINNTIGKIGEMTDILMVASTASGNGNLVYLTFNATAQGQSDIIIYESALLNSTGYNQTYTVAPGLVNVIPEFPTSMILPTFMMLTAAVAILIKVLRPRRRREYINS